MSLPKTLRQMLALPTAPFLESAVIEHIEKAVAEGPGLSTRRDRWGNLLVRYRNNPSPGKPVVFTAHTDHPGFASLRMTRAGRLIAAFRGWVQPEFFVGTGVRFWDGAWVRGVVRRITKLAKIYRYIGRTARPEEVEIEIDRPIPAGSAGMWDLPEAELIDGNVHARGCDDIAGAAALLEMLLRLSRKRAKCEAWGLFTRAEEVGFVGAIGAAKAGTIPRSYPIVAIETSKALANAKIGDGPILRVGDKSSIFTPDLTAFCDRAGQELAARRKSFKHQRKLMDGGTCESTAYYAYGYHATGMCVALGNYHNMNAESGKIEREYVSLDDWKCMVDWFEAIALARPSYKAGDTRVRAGLEDRFRQWRPLLARR